MVSVESDQMTTRDYTRAAKVLIAIQLRLLDSDEREENTDEPDLGLRAGID
jgi:hypothetical protein